MAEFDLDMLIDVARKIRVESEFNGRQINVPDFFQEDHVPLRWKFLDPNPGGGFANPYTILDLSNSSLRVGLGRPGEAPLSIQSNWNLEDNDTVLTGKLNLNTTEMRNELGSTTGNLSLILEAELKQGDAIYTYAANITLKREVLVSSANQPSPATEYYDKDQADAIFVKHELPPGVGITFKSLDGTQQAILDLDDNGNIRLSHL